MGYESEFVTKSDRFQALIRDIAMQIAGSDPKFVRKDHVSPEVVEHEKERVRLEAAATGKPGQVVAKLVEGKMSKYCEEVCLYEQPFIRDRSILVAQLIVSRVGELGEEIHVRRFARFKAGERECTIASDSDSGQKTERKQALRRTVPAPREAGWDLWLLKRTQNESESRVCLYH